MKQGWKRAERDARVYKNDLQQRRTCNAPTTKEKTNAKKQRTNEAGEEETQPTLRSSNAFDDVSDGSSLFA